MTSTVRLNPTGKASALRDDNRPPSCPYDNAVDESANKTLKAEFVYREQFSGLYDLQVKLNDYVWWYNNERMHSTLGYMSPVEFRKAGLSL